MCVDNELEQLTRALASASRHNFLEACERSAHGHAEADLPTQPVPKVFPDELQEMATGSSATAAELRLCEAASGLPELQEVPPPLSTAACQPGCGCKQCVWLDDIFASNRRWAKGLSRINPKFFTDMAGEDTPNFLWIGCADSRVVPNRVTGLQPGSLYVHRNVGNVAKLCDPNCMSALELAVNSLRVQHVVVCGHYGCSAVSSAMADGPQAAAAGIMNYWVSDIRQLREQHGEELRGMSRERQLARLCELNVVRQVANICNSSVVRGAWGRGQAVHVHGLIYDVTSGLLKRLVEPVSSGTQDFAVKAAAEQQQHSQELAAAFSAATQQLLQVHGTSSPSALSLPDVTSLLQGTAAAGAGPVNAPAGGSKGSDAGSSSSSSVEALQEEVAWLRSNEACAVDAAQHLMEQTWALLKDKQEAMQKLAEQAETIKWLQERLQFLESEAEQLKASAPTQLIKRYQELRDQPSSSLSQDETEELQLLEGLMAMGAQNMSAPPSSCPSTPASQRSHFFNSTPWDKLAHFLPQQMDSMAFNPLTVPVWNYRVEEATPAALSKLQQGPAPTLDKLSLLERVPHPHPPSHKAPEPEPMPPPPAADPNTLARVSTSSASSAGEDSCSMGSMGKLDTAQLEKLLGGNGPLAQGKAAGRARRPGSSASSVAASEPDLWHLLDARPPHKQLGGAGLGGTGLGGVGEGKGAAQYPAGGKRGGSVAETSSAHSLPGSSAFSCGESLPPAASDGPSHPGTPLGKQQQPQEQAQAAWSRLSTGSVPGDDTDLLAGLPIPSWLQEPLTTHSTDSGSTAQALMQSNLPAALRDAADLLRQHSTAPSLTQDSPLAYPRLTQDSTRAPAPAAAGSAAGSVAAPVTPVHTDAAAAAAAASPAAAPAPAGAAGSVAVSGSVPVVMALGTTQAAAAASPLAAAAAPKGLASRLPALPPKSAAGSTTSDGRQKRRVVVHHPASGRGSQHSGDRHHQSGSRGKDSRGKSTRSSPSHAPAFSSASSVLSSDLGSELQYRPRKYSTSTPSSYSSSPALALQKMAEEMRQLEDALWEDESVVDAHSSKDCPAGAAPTGLKARTASATGLKGVLPSSGVSSRAQAHVAHDGLGMGRAGMAPVQRSGKVTFAPHQAPHSTAPPAPAHSAPRHAAPPAPAPPSAPPAGSRAAAAVAATLAAHPHAAALLAHPQPSMQRVQLPSRPTTTQDQHLTHQQQQQQAATGVNLAAQAAGAQHSGSSSCGDSGSMLGGNGSSGSARPGGYPHKKRSGWLGALGKATAVAAVGLVLGQRALA